MPALRRSLVGKHQAHERRQILPRLQAMSQWLYSPIPEISRGFEDDPGRLTKLNIGDGLTLAQRAMDVLGRVVADHFT